jgi:hypothetical protein
MAITAKLAGLGWTYHGLLTLIRRLDPIKRGGPHGTSVY